MRAARNRPAGTPPPLRNRPRRTPAPARNRPARRERVARMQRARTATLATLGVSVILALTGCRSSPTAAAYVGPTQYSVSNVEQLSAEVRGNQAVDLPSQQDVAEMYVMRDVAKRIVDEKGWKVQRLDRAAIAQQLGLKADSKYVALRVEVEEYLGALGQNAPAVAPTDADLRDVYDRAKAAGLVQPGQTFEAIKPQIDSPQLRSALGARKLLTDGMKKYNVTVNPRYKPAEWPLLRFSGNKPAVVVPMDPRAGSVDAVVVPAS